MRILHFADVHLGMTNFGSIDNATGLHSRVLDYLDALDCVVVGAEASQPDLIIFAGDAFRTRSPNPTLVKHFSERIQRMADIAPVLIIIGNHDRQRGGEGKRHSTEVLRELIAKHPIVVESEITAWEMGGAYVVTVPWQYDMDVLDAIDNIDAMMEDAPDELPCILAGHISIEGAHVSEAYAYTLDEHDFCLPKDALQGFDYMALGHIHLHQSLGSGIVYSGSIERVNWGERDGPKGFVVADVLPGRRKWRFIDTCPRRMAAINIRWEDVGNLQDADVTDAIVRVNVSVPAGVWASMNMVLDMLPDDYYLLDAVNVIEPSNMGRSPVDAAYKVVNTLDLVEEYFDNKYPSDQDYVDTLYDYAADITEEAHQDDLEM